MKAGFRLSKIVFQTKEENISNNLIEKFHKVRLVKKNTDDYFKNKRVVLFSILGAFLTISSYKQLIKFEKYSERFKTLGIDEIYCCSVNDAFTLDAFFEKMRIKNIKLIPDGNGLLTKQIEMLIPLTNFGLGVRSRGYIAVITDGIIEKWWEEPKIAYNKLDSFSFKEAKPENCLEYLSGSE